MSEIQLTSSMRSNLLSLQNTQNLMDTTQNRLSTGLKVNSALDNPSAFFTASSLNNRASDLNSLLDDIGQGIQTLKTADEGIQALTDLAEQAKGLANQALSESDTTTRSQLAASFDDLLSQIDGLIADTSYRGTNLLSGDNLEVKFNEDGSNAITVTGVTYDSSGLSINAAASAWASNANINAAVTEVNSAITTLRNQASTFGSQLSTIQTREDFTKAMVNNLQEGASKLTLADSNEEGANMLALQTRQQLGTVSLSLASQASQSVLRLF